MDSQATLHGGWSSFRRAVRQALWRNSLLLVTVTVHFAAAHVIALSLGKPFTSGAMDIIVTVAQIFLPFFLIAVVVARFLHMAVRVRPEKPIQWLLGDLRATVLDRDRIVNGIVAFGAVAVMAGAFTFIKDQIPLIAPFSWDPAFAALDRMLHGGHDPWRLLLPVLGTPLRTTAVNAVYNAWFFVMFFVVLVACFGKPGRRDHTAFLLAFALTWAIAGNLLAILLSSAGPVYYAALGYGDYFQPQMDLLHDFARTSPVWALDIQRLLLEGYQTDGPVRGISAMPSLHVASSVIMALYGFSLGRWVGWLLTAFAVCILIGSVHLAWHYAVDGYLALLVAAPIWYASRWLVRRMR